MKRLSAVLSVPILAVSLWAFWWEPVSLHNETHKLAIPSWPPRYEALKVGVLSDLHVGSPFNHFDHLKTSINLTLKAKPTRSILENG
jgi:predicted MPP superfamily phosphohydrolase